MKKNIATLAAAAASLGTAAAIALAPAAANAETAAFGDAHGDMAHGADIHRVKVVNEKNVRVKVRTADLVRSFKSGASAVVYVDTDPAQKGPEFAFLGGLFEGTDYGLVRTNGWKVGDHPRVVRGFHSLTLDYKNDVATFQMSRKALGLPDEVRVAVKTAGEQRDGDIVRDWLHGRRDFTSWVAHGEVQSSATP